MLLQVSSLSLSTTWPATKFPIVQLTDIEIKDDIGIKNGILRKRFIRELKELKKTADYTSCDGGLTANFLSRWITTKKWNDNESVFFWQGWTRVSWVHLLSDPRRTEPRLDAAFECSWPWGYAQGKEFADLWNWCPVISKLSFIADKKTPLNLFYSISINKDCGVESAIHRHKIIDAAINGTDDESFADRWFDFCGIILILSLLFAYCMHAPTRVFFLLKLVFCFFFNFFNELLYSLYSEPSWDVYLAYPGKNGGELASLIKMQLEIRGLSVSVDPHDSPCLR